MRIAVLSWESLHSIAVGGVASHVTELAGALVKKGHNVHIFTRRTAKQSAHDRIDGVHYHRCAYPVHHDFVDDINNMCRSFVDRVFEVEDFVGHFDVVHAHDWLSANAMIWVKRGRKHKCVLTIHATEYARCGNAFPSGRSVRIRDQERAGTYWADRLVAVSQATKNEIMWMYEVPDQKISVIFNGVSPSRFEGSCDPGEDKRHYGIAPLDPTVLFCGRLVWQKGPDILMEAIPSILSYYGNAKFVFVGDGEMRSGLEARARQLGVAGSVRFLGYRDGDELIRLFNLADVVCMPSRNEPFGIVALEAWSACKPIVITNKGGPSEYVRHETDGLKIDPNPNSITWGVCALFSNFKWARWMGQNGRKAVEERFTWEQISEQLIAVYEELCPVSTGASCEINETDQPEELLANLTLRANPIRKSSYQALTSYKRNLIRLGFRPQRHNGTLSVKGNLDTLLAAVKDCYQQIDTKGLRDVACTLDLETSQINSRIKNES